MIIPEIDDTHIRAIAITAAMKLEPVDVQALMAIADVIVDYIDPLADSAGEFTFTLDETTK